MYIYIYIQHIYIWSCMYIYVVVYIYMSIVLGYLFSLWFMIVATTVNIIIYKYPLKLPYIFSIFPHLSFQRIFYNLSTRCVIDSCVKSFEELDTETWCCIQNLYIIGVVSFVLGIYLNEIFQEGNSFLCCFNFLRKNRSSNSSLIRENEEGKIFESLAYQQAVSLEDLDA